MTYRATIYRSTERCIPKPSFVGRSTSRLGEKQTFDAHAAQTQQEFFASATPTTPLHDHRRHWFTAAAQQISPDTSWLLLVFVLWVLEQRDFDRLGAERCTAYTVMTETLFRISLSVQNTGPDSTYNNHERGMAPECGDISVVQCRDITDACTRGRNCTITQANSPPQRPDPRSLEGYRIIPAHALSL